jgi:hypothetical protein
MDMSTSVAGFFDSIAKHQILGSTDVERLKNSWGKPGREGADDPTKLARWVVVNQNLSAHQAKKILEGKAGDLVFGKYRIKDAVESGPLSGWLIAEDNLQRPVYLEPIASAISSDGVKFQTLKDKVTEAAAFQNPQVTRVIGLLEHMGKHCLVREFLQGESLQSLVKRRARPKPLQVAKLFSLLFQACAQLRESGLYLGQTTLESFVLTQTGKPGASHKTVRIMDALIDPKLLGLKSSGGTNEQEIILRLGSAFYEVLTLQKPGTNPAPIASLVPETPEMIAEFVDSLVSPDENSRPANLISAGKQLRVVLAAEEHSLQSEADDVVVAAIVVPSKAASFANESNEDSEEALSGADKLLASVQSWLAKMGIATRDLILFTAGALTFLFVIILVLVMFSFDLIPLLCLGLGGAMGYGIERFLKHAESENATESAPNMN